jgi:hypothetical protein
MAHNDSGALAGCSQLKDIVCGLSDFRVQKLLVLVEDGSAKEEAACGLDCEFGLMDGHEVGSVAAVDVAVQEAEPAD